MSQLSGMSKVIVGLGSMNTAKKTAVRNAFQLLGRQIELESKQIDSLVSPMPKSEQETIQGALNRAKEMSKLYPEYDFVIGLEGGIKTNTYGTFLINWAVLINKEGEIGIGSGPSIHIPKTVVREIELGQELSSLLNNIRDNNLNYDGAMDILSLKMISRQGAFGQAIICAFSSIINHHKFTEAN